MTDELRALSEYVNEMAESETVHPILRRMAKRAKPLAEHYLAAHPADGDGAMKRLHKQSEYAP